MIFFCYVVVVCQKNVIFWVTKNTDCVNYENHRNGPNLHLLERKLIIKFWIAILFWLVTEIIGFVSPSLLKNSLKFRKRLLKVTQTRRLFSIWLQKVSNSVASAKFLRYILKVWFKAEIIHAKANIFNYYQKIHKKICVFLKNRQNDHDLPSWHPNCFIDLDEVSFYLTDLNSKQKVIFNFENH